MLLFFFHQFIKQIFSLIQILYQQLGVIYFLIFGSIFALSITGYAYRDTLKRQLYKSLNHTLTEYGTQNLMDKDLDRIQTHVNIF